ncbi:hypothetical protein DFR24_2180 [Panacagrimonas perspica]|uniref:Transglycosylase SLT domain-containing protein n=1 Tax=Panacagrimonas perspica TaxID=381431 RepID=A0A4V3F6J1_9GAMM|nr:hypothetical protein [Panacagrimonas perspica]TDU32776.1 hypothetical protein DFR24_2180 [Panacagrimonas perspica]THD05653.1 hypothetical protein B1810_02765 [Panacagrimonas perspica]
MVDTAKYSRTISAKEMRFFVSIGNNAYSSIFSNELIVAICWEESRFSNIPQLNGPAVGFGQLQKEGLNKANQHRSGNPYAKGPGFFSRETVLGSEPISISAVSHCLAGYYDGFKTARKNNALKAYAGGFVSATNDLIPPRWLACEAALKQLPGPAHLNPEKYMEALNLALSPSNPPQRLGSSGPLYDFVRAKLFPELVPQLDYQSNWRWCKKCQGLFYGGNPTKGVCPAGGAHTDIGSGNYQLSAGKGPGQAGWRWCSKCQGFWFNGDGITGVCPAGSNHISTGSGQYLAQGFAGTGQNGWRWCRDCSGMFFIGNGSVGVCAGNKSRHHDGSGSGDYALTKI